MMLSTASNRSRTIWFHPLFRWQRSIQGITDQIKAMVKFAGYIVSIITDLAIDVSKAVLSGIGSALTSFGVQGAGQAMQTAEDALDNHRRLIEAVVSTGLMVGATIASGGLALPIACDDRRTTEFPSGWCWQSDERAIAKKQEEQDFVWIAKRTLIITKQ